MSTKNKLIAEYMRGVYLRRKDPFDGRLIEEIQFEKGMDLHILNTDHSTTENIVHLRYHCDWSWLMPVVDKICKDGIGGFRTFGMKNDANKYMVRINGYKLFESEFFINAVYMAVVDYIE